MLIQQPAYLYFLGSLERIMALVLQIAFTMLVLYAVKQKKYIFLVYAILFHAFVDFFAALYQTKTINIFVAEGITLLFTIGAVVLIRKMKAKLMSVPGKNNPPIGGLFLWIVTMVIAFSFLQLPLCFCIYNDVLMKLFYFILRKGSEKINLAIRMNKKS